MVRKCRTAERVRHRAGYPAGALLDVDGRGDTVAEFDAVEEGVGGAVVDVGDAVGAGVGEGCAVGEACGVGEATGDAGRGCA